MTGKFAPGGHITDDLSIGCGRPDDLRGGNGQPAVTLFACLNGLLRLLVFCNIASGGEDALNLAGLVFIDGRVIKHIGELSILAAYGQRDNR